MKEGIIKAYAEKGEEILPELLEENGIFENDLIK